uniref:Uncharacterized protein n=1 Tax=Arundo donax TaxID=35708 RepID=A0A0A9CA41_ARUDO
MGSRKFSNSESLTYQ